METLTLDIIEKTLQDIFSKERAEFVCIINCTTDNVEQVLKEFNIL